MANVNIKCLSRAGNLKIARGNRILHTQSIVLLFALALKLEESQYSKS